MALSVEIKNISKRYKDKEALNGVSLHVRKGEIFGLIGPDGAGKTTLFRILTSLLLPDSGEARMEGHDVVNDYRMIRKITGYMPGNFSLYYDLTVEENLRFFASIFGASVEENYHLVEDIYRHIEPFRHRRAGKLSGGMKQKLALSCALIHQPKVLILDEPTTGVDAVSRKEFWDMLQRLQSTGLTTLVSTPYMDEATRCDRVALIQKGRILSVDTPAAIMEGYDKPLLAARSDNMFGLLYDVAEHPATLSAYRFGDAIHVTLDKEQEAGNLREFLEDKGHASLSLQKITAGIEDRFLSLMTEE